MMKDCTTSATQPHDVTCDRPTEPLADFIARLGITMTAAPADRNPNLADDAWAAQHWRCLLRTPDRHRMTVYFSQGAARTERPTAADVLNCLASDAASIEEADDFEDWAGELGYGADSRAAERIYLTVQRQAFALKRLLGPHQYRRLLFHTERL